METLLQNAALIIAIIGMLAFSVAIITQVFKGVGFLSKIPTDALVFVLSIGLTVTVFVAYMQHTRQSIVWYMIVAVITVGFIVAYVAMFGWERLSNLWKRFYKAKDIYGLGTGTDEREDPEDE